MAERIGNEPGRYSLGYLLDSIPRRFGHCGHEPARLVFRLLGGACACANNRTRIYEADT